MDKSAPWCVSVQRERSGISTHPQGPLVGWGLQGPTCPLSRKDPGTAGGPGWGCGYSPGVNNSLAHVPRSSPATPGERTRPYPYTYRPWGVCPTQMSTPPHCTPNAITHTHRIRAQGLPHTPPHLGLLPSSLSSRESASPFSFPPVHLPRPYINIHSRAPHFLTPAPSHPLPGSLMLEVFPQRTCVSIFTYDLG